jgi:hypothetical protein
MGLIFRTAAVILALTVPCSSAHLTAPAQRAFDNYAAAVEKRLAQQHSSPDTYLATLNLGAIERDAAGLQLRSGAIRMEPVNGGTREVSGGLLIECEAISLTRDVPAGLGWLIAPVIEEMPRDSLKFTLAATQNALSSNALKEARR